MYCAAESHELWEHTYSRRGDNPWVPDPFEYIGGERGRIRTPRRGGGIEYVDAAGRVIKSWDFGRVSVDHPLGRAARFMADIDRARKAADLSDDSQLPLGRRYRMRCPLCGDALRRSDSQSNKHFNWLWEQGITRISLSGLRELGRLL